MTMTVTMQSLARSGIVFAAAMMLPACETVEQADTQGGFVPIFDGSSLAGWSGDPARWRVSNGAIIGETHIDTPLEHNTFLIWQDGAPANFHLQLEFFLESGNSGVQYRSYLRPEIHPYRVAGFQADIAPKWLGILYGEAGAGGILARRGESVSLEVREGVPAASAVTQFADADELISAVDFASWNSLEIIADGADIKHIVNGTTFMIANDKGTGQGEDGGLIALQLHKGDPMKVMFRNIKIKTLSPAQR